MHTTSLDLFKQVSMSYCSCSLYSYVHMYSSCFKLQLQMFFKNERKLYVYLCVCVWGGKRSVNYTKAVHRSPRVQCKQIYGPLSLFPSESHQSLSCLLPPPHSTWEDDRGKSWAKLSPFEPFWRQFYRLREGGRESGRVKRKNCEIQPLFHRETPGRKDCVSPKAAKEGGPPGSNCFSIAL